MSDLDKKLNVFLEEICERFYWEEYNDPDEVRCNEFPAWREEIKKIFVDAGYDAYVLKKMTGQEWYDRFTSAIEADGYRMIDAGSVYWDAGDVVRAAKKATGIEDGDA